MGKIPVLEDGQMDRLRTLVGSRRNINLCPQSQKKNRLLPGEDPEPAKSGVILAAVVTTPTSGGGIGTVSPVTIGAGGAITPTSGGNITTKFPYLDGYN